MVLMCVEVVDDDAWCAELTPEERRWMLKEIETNTQLQLSLIHFDTRLAMHRTIERLYRDTLAGLHRKIAEITAA